MNIAYTAYNLLTTFYLGNPEQADVVGGLARKAVLLNKGSAGKHAAVIYKLLMNRSNHF